ncbi:Antirestriction protein KlcA [Devosia sp. LC5]|uniref:antirestriction protein n=1 Tax=Devosia sp. LC5 TaxID=1502724 RepID=UPI0004E406F8|nr:antirestriction protein [Devosia sp. LC5]KFC62072.1 Antirestriction protein KlcA [Devosia sp. LC5]
MNLPAPATSLATLVPEARRMEFLPRLFGLPLLIIAENAVFSFMEWLSPDDYGGGLWDFYELDGEPLYLAPTSKPRFRISCEGNGFDGEVSADAAGIIATLFTFSHLSFRHESDRLAEGYARLYAYAADHPAAPDIFQAID